jgi:hypothetical protein
MKESGIAGIGSSVTEKDLFATKNPRINTVNNYENYSTALNKSPLTLPSPARSEG